MSERILGIVGGTGPESTIDYYRRLVVGGLERTEGRSAPHVVIDSVDAKSLLPMFGRGDWSAVGAKLLESVRRLAAAGCGAALFASNTTHLAFEEVAPRSPIPLIHIVDAARSAAAARGFRRLGLLGTRFVVESSMYDDHFGPAFTIIRPPADERSYLHETYVAELIPGVIREATRSRLVEIIAAMRARDRIDAVILGGTELALILTGTSYADVAVLDTAQTHVSVALDWLSGSDERPLDIGGRLA